MIQPEQSVWWVLRSRPRCEKKIASILREQNLEAFLPCRSSRKEYASKTVSFTLPLFPGYVFGNFTPLQKNKILNITPSAGVIEIIDQFTFVQQINALRELLKRSQDVKVCPFIGRGKRVQITTGKFRGMEGIVCRFSRGNRLVLSLDLLQQSVEVELPSEAVKLTA